MSGSYNTAAHRDKATEEKGSPVEDWGAEGLKATVKLRCNWTDRYAVMADILDPQRAYPRLKGAGDVDLAWAISGGILPAGKQELETAGHQYGTYAQAICTIVYGSGGAGGGGDPGGTIYTESLEPQAEMLKIPGKDFYWSGDADKKSLDSSEAPSKLVISFDYSQTLYRLATIHNDYLARVGHVNLKAITADMIGFVFPAETLLYNPPSMTRSADSTGIGKWNLTTRFSYRPNGWNKFWHAKMEAWVEMKKKSDDSVYKNFPTALFANLGTFSEAT